MISEFVPLLIF